MYEESWVYAGEGGDVCDGYFDTQCKTVKVYDVPLVGKPKTYVRFLPPEDEAKDQSNLPFQVDPDGKTIKFGKNEKVRTDGVFRIDVRQSEIADIASYQLVERLINGTSGIVAAVGPHASGKAYSLFGPLPKFRFNERGLFSRVLERLFWISDRSMEIEYILRMGGIEIHQNRIRDLFTFLDIEGSEKSHCRMFFQRIVNPEHGLALLLTALAGQALIPRENSCVEVHTIIYIDVIGRTSVIDPAPFNSRLLFAKFASVPSRDYCMPVDGAKKVSYCSPLELKKGCMRDKNDSMSEAIAVRQDLLSILEMCETAKKKFRLNTQKESKARVSLPIPISRFFAKSRLANILRGIASGKSEVRVLLCVRSEEPFKRASIESLRFGKVTRSVPIIIKTTSDEFRIIRREFPGKGEEDQETYIFNGQEQKLAESVPSDLFFALNPDVLKNLQVQITTFLAKEGLSEEEQDAIGSGDVKSLYFKYFKDSVKAGKKHRSLLLKADPTIGVVEDEPEKNPQIKKMITKTKDKPKKLNSPLTKTKPKSKKNNMRKKTEKEKVEEKDEVKEIAEEIKKSVSPDTCYSPELLAQLSHQKAIKKGRISSNSTDSIIPNLKSKINSLTGQYNTNLKGQGTNKALKSLECGQMYLGNNEKMSAVFMDVQGQPIVHFQGFTEPKKEIPKKAILMNAATSTTQLHYCELVDEVIIEGGESNEREYGGEFDERSIRIKEEEKEEPLTQDIGVGTEDDIREAKRRAEEEARQMLRNKELVKAGFPGLLGDLGLFCPWFEGKFGLVDDELSQELLLHLSTLKENKEDMDGLLDEIYKMAKKRAAILIPLISKKSKQGWIIY